MTLFVRVQPESRSAQLRSSIIRNHPITPQDLPCVECVCHLRPDSLTHHADLDCDFARVLRKLSRDSQRPLSSPSIWHYFQVLVQNFLSSLPAAGITTLSHSSSRVGALGGLSPCSQVSSEIFSSRSSTGSGAAAAVARSRNHRHTHSNAAGEQQVQPAGAASTSTASTSAALSPPRRQQPRTMPPPPCRRRRCLLSCCCRSVCRQLV